MTYCGTAGKWNMIDDFRHFEDDTMLQADVCVIGTGAAGISIAREFFGTNLQVLLLEGGGTSPEPETQALYEVECIGLPFPGALDGRAREFGGTTTLWGGTIIPLSETDFHQRPWVPYSGWPISLAELAPYYLRAEGVLQLAEDGVYDERIWQRFGIEPPALDPHKLRLVFSKEKTWPFRPKEYPKNFRSVYIEALRKASNVRVLLHANVTNLKANAEATAVVEAEIRTLEGKRGSARARTYIVACGGIETPRLLLLSNGVHASSLGNQHDLVGRFFQGHPKFEAATIHTDTPKYLQERFEFLIKDRQLFRSRLELSDPIQEQEHLPKCDADIIFDMPEESGIQAAMELYRSWLGRHKPENLLQNMYYVLKGFPEVVHFGVPFFLRGTWPMPKPKTIRLQCRAEQYPEPDSRITLSDQLDALGLRKACIDWHLSELERKTARRMVETVGAEFERLNLGKLELSDWMRPEIEDWRSWVKEGNHHSGATRMADDPRQGVVDRNCRVHGIENLYISSSSVFPTTGTANPTFTIIALAIRLADHLKQKL